MAARATDDVLVQNFDDNSNRAISFSYYARLQELFLELGLFVARQENRAALNFLKSASLLTEVEIHEIQCHGHHSSYEERGVCWPNFRQCH
jgi:hypothetical protein